MDVVANQVVNNCLLTVDSVSEVVNEERALVPVLLWSVEDGVVVVVRVIVFEDDDLIRDSEEPRVNSCTGIEEDVLETGTHGLLGLRVKVGVVLVDC